MTRIACLLLLAGCAQNGDPCAGTKDVCIGLRVEGSVGGLDQLVFSIDTPETTPQKRPDPPMSLKLPVRVALFPPPGTTGTVHVKCDGLGNTALIAHGEVDAPLGSGHSQVTLTLTAAAANDLAVNADGASDLAIHPDLANCPMVTACLDGDGCCPSGCTNSTDHDCPAVCGNKMVEDGEVCDDGNTLNGDGCDPTCRFAGVMTTLSGAPGAAGWADGVAARFGTQLAGLASDGTKLWILDASTSTIREFTLAGGTPMTLIGAPYDRRYVDGTFDQARINGQPPMAMFPQPSFDLVYLNQKLYFNDYNGNDWLLREVDLANHTVTSIPKTVVKDGVVNLVTDGSSLFYVSTMNTVDKWTPGDASSAQVSSNFGYSSFVPTPKYFYLSAGSQVWAAGDAGSNQYAGLNNFQPTCSNSPYKLSAAIRIQSELQADSSGNLFFMSCNALTQIAPEDGGVTTVAGELNMPGYADGARASAQFGLDNQASLPLLYLSATQFFVADSENAVIRAYAQASDSIITLAGSSPGVHAKDVRGDAAGSRYTQVSGVVSDGTNLYALGHAAGSSGTPRTLVRIDLASGASTDLFSFSADARAITLIGTTLYVALADGSIHSIGTDGMNDTLVAGLGGNAKYPPSDGAAQMAVIDPTALATDGSDVYFVDAAKLIRKLSPGAQMVSPVAGTQDATDLVDASGSAAHFANPSGLAFAAGSLYTLDGMTATSPSTIRRIELSTRAVTTLVGQGDGTPKDAGDIDGVGPAGRIAGARYLTTDGVSLFISDAATPNLTLPIKLSPTIRQVDLKTLTLTTMIGQRGVWTLANGTGTNALVHAPGPIAWDTTTHSIYFFDTLEGVFQKIR